MNGPAASDVDGLEWQPLPRFRSEYDFWNDGPLAKGTRVFLLLTPMDGCLQSPMLLDEAEARAELARIRMIGDEAYLFEATVDVCVPRLVDE